MILGSNLLIHLFQKVGVEETALLRLKAVVGRLNVERVRLHDLFGYGGLLVPLADIKTVTCWLFYFMGLFLSDVEFEVEERQTRHDTEAWIDAWRQDKDIVAYFLGELEFYRNRLIFLNNVCERLKTRVIRINKHEEKKEG